MFLQFLLEGRLCFSLSLLFGLAVLCLIRFTSELLLSEPMCELLFHYGNGAGESLPVCLKRVPAHVL